MQSTSSRTRHSSNIFAPLISLPPFVRLAPLIGVDMYSASQIQLQKQKGHRLVCFAPPMALNRFPVGLRGAGYDDRENNNAYRNGAGDYAANGAACKRGRHRTISFEFSLEVS